MPYILCVKCPNIVIPGEKCPRPSSSWSSPSTSCFGQHPGQSRSDTSHSFFSKLPIYFLVPASLVNLLLENTPKILNWLKLQDSKRVHFYANGAQNWCSCPFPHTLFSSSSGLNSGRLNLLYVLTTVSLTILPTKDPSEFIFAAKVIEVTPFLSQMVLTSWFHFFSGISSACLLSAFLSAIFLVSMHWHTR